MALHLVAKTNLNADKDLRAAGLESQEKSDKVGLGTTTDCKWQTA